MPQIYEFGFIDTGRLRVLRVKRRKLCVTRKTRNPHTKMYDLRVETREFVNRLLRVIYHVTVINGLICGVPLKVGFRIKNQNRCMKSNFPNRISKGPELRKLVPFAQTYLY